MIPIMSYDVSYTILQQGENMNCIRFSCTFSVQQNEIHRCAFNALFK
jgi:hypothetical protein